MLFLKDAVANNRKQQQVAAARQKQGRSKRQTASPAAMAASNRTEAMVGNQNSVPRGLRRTTGCSAHTFLKAPISAAKPSLLALAMRLLGVLFTVCLVCIDGAAWNTVNNPNRWWYTLSTRYNSLPRSGAAAQPAWSGNYWPNNLGGIAHRWGVNARRPSFNYRMFSLSELLRMKPESIRLLSPAEKYDIWMNRLDYPTVKSEWRRCTPRDPRWYGLCHGWAPAAMLFRQPNPVTLTAANNVTIPFGSADVKAMLSYFLAEVCAFTAPCTLTYYVLRA